MNKKYFVTGIGTEIGKTIVSSVLVEKLKADYWKPIQSGDLENSDTDKVKKLISNSNSKFHPETYQFTQAFSPHLSAKLDHQHIDLSKINLPKTENNLIIEGAGGILVPLNDQDLMVDLIKKLNAEVILVSKNYLGSINHTLLTVEALKSRGIAIKGIIFNGVKNPSSEEIIAHLTQLTILGYVPELQKLDQEQIKEAGIFLNL
jgi:dethiobiotin synthetase